MDATIMQPVTDPNILAQLNGQPQAPQQAPAPVQPWQIPADKAAAMTAQLNNAADSANSVIKSSNTASKAKSTKNFSIYDNQSSSDLTAAMKTADSIGEQIQPYVDALDKQVKQVQPQAPQNLKPVTDPNILAQLNGSQPQQQPVNAPIAPTQTPIAPQQSPLSNTPQAPVQTPDATNMPSTKSNIITGLDAINSAGSGIREGAMDATGNTLKVDSNLLQYATKILGMDTVSKAIGSATNYLSDKGQQVKDYVNSDPISVQATNRFPRTHAVGATVGNIGTGMLEAGAETAPITGLVNKIAPLAKNATFTSTALHNALSNGLATSLYNAGLNPDHPVRSAVTGLLEGGAIGLGAGYLGAKVQHGNAIINDVKNDAIQANRNPNDINTQNTIKAELNNGGRSLAKKQVLSELGSQVQSRLDMSPPEEGQARVDAAYKPLQDAPAVAVPTQMNQALAPMENNPRLPLPPKPQMDANGQTNLNQLIEYNKQVAGFKQNAWDGVTAEQKTMSSPTYAEAQMYSNLYDSVEKDIETLSNQQGLGNQYQIAKKMAFDNSINGKMVSLFNHAMTGPDNELNANMFDKHVNNVLLDPKVRKNPEMMTTIEGIKNIVTATRKFATGAGSGNAGMQIPLLGSIYNNFVHSDGGIGILKLVGKMSPTSQAVRAIAEKLVTGLLLKPVNTMVQNNQTQQQAQQQTQQQNPQVSPQQNQ